MAERTKKGRKPAGQRAADEVFRNRLNGSQLLRVIERIYKKEYGYSIRKYLLTYVPRGHAEQIVSTLESTPPSITKMFKRRLHGRYKKEWWIPMIPFPAVTTKGRKRLFVEEVHKSGGFVVDFPKLAEEGRLLYTTMRPSEFLAYAYAGELIEKRSDDGVSSTESDVKRKEKELRQDRPLQTPYLKLDLARRRFVLHDGRHRVVAAHERGVKLIPVMIEHQAPAGRAEWLCLRNRSRWRKEDSPSPNLRGRDSS